MNGDVLDMRDRFRAEGNPMAVPMSPHDVGDLARLRQLEVDLGRPVIHLLAELAHQRQVEAEARDAMRKVEEHERTGWQRITLGAFNRLRAKLAER